MIKSPNSYIVQALINSSGFSLLRQRYNVLKSADHHRKYRKLLKKKKKENKTLHLPIVPIQMIIVIQFLPLDRVCINCSSTSKVIFPTPTVVLFLTTGTLCGPEEITSTIFN